VTAATDLYGDPAARDDNWQTPEVVLSGVRETFRGVINLDPCASPEPTDWFATNNMNPTREPWEGAIKAGQFGYRQDGLSASWSRRVYVNPPFSESARWIEKCHTEAPHCEGIIMLIPTRSDTRYWQTYAPTADAICFWKGRIKFIAPGVGAAPQGAKFPASLLYWGGEVARFVSVFRSKGMVVIPS
jgi:hypothetical protein